jgi:UDP-2,3-diacylglucosamine pyrophosphatase LpxH
MIIITDAHVSKAAGNHATFFRMLESLEGNHQNLIFLGDIFDLWVAFPRYEENIHRDFIGWCREQKSHRSIGFMEGNHEYYLARQSAQAFAWCSAKAWWRDESGVLFVHGDQINRQDRNYLSFRKLAKNQVTQFIVRILPFGPRILESLKHGLKKTNRSFRLHLPQKEIEVFAESRFAEGFDTIFVGHFHQEYLYSNPDSKKLYVLPDWFSTQKVTVFDRESKKVTSIHWKEIDKAIYST